MKSFKRIFTILTVLSFVAAVSSSFAQQQEKEKPWTGSLKDGTEIDNESLKKILNGHLEWLKSNFRNGNRANLQKANLRGANLQEADLTRADLQEANLRGANLQKANLRVANLQRAHLTGANLQEADLWGANLQKAVLWGANFQEANLWGANLQETNLLGANLQEANLRVANLQETNLEGAYLQKADLLRANLQEADLTRANLQEANLTRTNLHEANLWGANLQETNLLGANLQEANLRVANLQETNLEGAYLQKADLRGANLKGAVFELQTDSLPNIPSMAKAHNLSLLSYNELPHALVELRNAFKEAGLRKQEREITYAIKHTGFKNAFSEDSNSSKLTKIEVTMGWIFFDLTCKWGSSPERPLFILLILIFVFAVPYTLAISGDIYGKKKTDGIWKVWIPDRMRDDLGKDAPKELLDDLTPNSLRVGFQFSILSAFHFGWRDLNVGNWIARMQWYEYKLQATGWARMVSGIQSLISVYLVTLAALAYFSRPFESY